MDVSWTIKKAAAAAKSLVMSDSVRPHRRQPTRLPHLWDSPGKNTGVGCHFLLQCMKEKSERSRSVVSDSLRLHGLQPTRLLCPWDFPGKNTGVGCHCWAPKNCCFWTVVLEKTLESPLDCKEIQPVHPKGNQSWIFVGRTDTYWSLEKILIWKHWRQQEGTTEDEMVGWHHWLNGHEFIQAPGVGDGQESLACCSPWGPKEWDTTEWLNRFNTKHFF